MLVHGGGRSATKVAAMLGVESRMVNGRRITDADMLNVVTRYMAGRSIRILWHVCKPAVSMRWD